MERLKHLDALRGLAVMAVVLFHFLHQYPKLFGEPALGIDALVIYGGYGVDLFFMISGFVIFMTLGRSAGASSFLKARVVRLYPAYWIAVLLTFACTSLASLDALKVTSTDFFVNLSMLQQLLGFAHVDGAYWSLQVEWTFYLVASLLFFTGCFRRPLLGLAAWLAGATLVQLLPWGVGPGAKVAHIVESWLALRHMHLFIMGAVFFHAWRDGRFGFGHAALVLAALARQVLNESWDVGLLTAGYAVVFLLIVKGRLGLLAGNRPLLFLGKISYSLYLVHQNIGYLVIHGLLVRGSPHLLAVSGALAVVLLVAILLNRYVEEPAVRAYRQRAGVRQPAAPRSLELNVPVRVEATRS